MGKRRLVQFIGHDNYAGRHDHRMEAFVTNTLPRYFQTFEHIVKSWLAVCVNNTECFISIGNRMIFSDI